MRAWTLAFPLAAGRYDIIHFEYSGLAVSYLDALPLLGSAKLVISCRGAAEQITPVVRPRRAAQLRELFTAVHRVHCVSAEMLRTMQGYGLDPANAFVNHPSIDLSRFERQRPYPEKAHGPFRLLSVGRLHWKKGFDHALLAVRHLVDAGYDVYYDILGGGAEEERLRFTIHDLHLGGRVELRGPRSPEEVRDALEVADVYLQPSVSEGLSNAVLEAMAMETPVVSTGVGGMAEAIDHGCEGLLVPPWQPTALAASVGALLESAALRRRMGRAGRQRVERQFGIQRQIAQFVEEYHALLAQPRPPLGHVATVV